MAYRIQGLGWMPDPPDFRDWKVRHDRVRSRMRQLLPHLAAQPMKGSNGSAATPVGPLRADLRRWCSPIEDQGDLGSCTANATVGALEYFECKTRGVHVDASRLFLYKMTRRYMGWTGDSGAFLRTSIKALRLFGALPEAYWKYDVAHFDDEPGAFQYALAQNFKAVEYFRLEEDVAHLKSSLDAGLPFTFGFTCFTSIFGPDVKKTGVIPYPGPKEAQEGGHAVLAVGYTDSHVLVRNSWGHEWGQGGYGFLPWTYFDASHPLADDCWALVNAAWVPEDEVEQDRDVSVRVRGRGLAPAPAAISVPGPTLEPVIKVAMGTDPLRHIPLRFGARGVTASSEATAALSTTPGPVAVSLKSLTLNESFDFSLFGAAVNELYFTAIAWDLSGTAPLVYPPPGITVKGTHAVKEDQTITFIGDGVELWPARQVTGALYIRILIMESDDDVRRLGEHLESVRNVVSESDLTRALTNLAISGAGVAVAPAAGELEAIAAAANVLTKAVATVLRNNDDDVVALFEGSYGADRALSTRVERYDQRGATVELDVRA